MLDQHLSQHRTSWGIEIGGVRLGWTRLRELRGTAPAAPAAPAMGRALWGLAIGAFASLSALALLVVGAGATGPTQPARYAVSVAVPETAAHVAKPAKRKPATGRVAPRATSAITAASFDAADETYVARAMATGAFQEWEDAAGQRRFLTAGPARAIGGKTCRDMALLVRLTEGDSRVRSAEHCTTEPVSDLPTEPLVELPEVSGGADQ